MDLITKNSTVISSDRWPQIKMRTYIRLREVINVLPKLARHNLTSLWCVAKTNRCVSAKWTHIALGSFSRILFSLSNRCWGILADGRSRSWSPLCTNLCLPSCAPLYAKKYIVFQLVTDHRFEQNLFLKGKYILFAITNWTEDCWMMGIHVMAQTKSFQYRIRSVLTPLLWEVKRTEVQKNNIFWSKSSAHPIQNQYVKSSANSLENI